MNCPKHGLLSTLCLTLIVSLIPGTYANAKETSETPTASFAVFSDPHYYAPELGTSGKAFEEYLANDRKLLAESKAILEETVDQIKKSDVDFVLVSGDLTKDGERVSHEQFTKYLKELEKDGKKVYVIAGNHDINNPDAVEFKGSKTTPVKRVSPAEFKKIYKDFGYKEAIAKDANSLSYVVEPVEGLWVVVMDAALYDNNIRNKSPETGGAFSSKRMNWIKKQLEKAKKEGKLVIGMSHHGIIEHFSIQDDFFSDYVVKDWQKVSSELADLGMKAVFTGHYHANDIVKKESNKGNTIYDIETGSLVTFPSPYRFVELTEDQELKIETKHVKKIDYDTDGKSFPQYSKEFLVSGMNGLVPKMLTVVLMQQGMEKDEAAKKAQELVKLEVAPSITVGDLLVNAMVGHYSGDESTNAQTEAIIKGLLSSDDKLMKFLGNALSSLMNDPNPKDNDVELELE